MGMIAFTLNVGSLSPGDYVGTIYVDTGTAGTALVTVNIKLVSILYKVHFPLVVRYTPGKYSYCRLLSQFA